MNTPKNGRKGSAEAQKPENIQSSATSQNSPAQASEENLPDSVAILSALSHNTFADNGGLISFIQNSIDVTPHSQEEQSIFKAENVLNSLRFGEYDTEAAIAEFVDNSVEAGAGNIRLFIQAEKTATGKNSISQNKANKAGMVTEIGLVDDGVGMDYDTIRKCLVLGESLRKPTPTGGKGIGRFGVGMTMAGISLAKRIEVYSRSSKKEEFRFVFVDLDVISSEKKGVIRIPELRQPPAEYAKYLEGSTGTIIVLKTCDRLQGHADESKKGVDKTRLSNSLKAFLGRTFRKFIHAGVSVSVNEEPVFLHDPLYLLGPTRFDEKGQTDPKAHQVGNIIRIPLEIVDKPGQTAYVTVKLTLLPAEWRTHPGAGGNTFASERKINENQGVSVLRADREVLYGHVPYILGAKGQSASNDIDRWWGCEISFPPELDAHFQVRYIKRGAEPVPSLRDKIRKEIHLPIQTLREQIRADWKMNSQAAAAQKSVFDEAEKAMAGAETKLPNAPQDNNTDTSPENQENQLNKLAEEASVVGKKTDGSKTTEERKQELASKPYSIVPVEYPASIFYEPVFLPGKIIVKLNVNHPFYKQIFAPMCGNIDHLNDESDFLEGADTVEQRLARKGFMLMLLSHARAEGFFMENHKDTLENIRHQWGMALGTALTE
jgi:hypothetical protein